MAVDGVRRFGLSLVFGLLVHCTSSPPSPSDDAGPADTASEAGSDAGVDPCAARTDAGCAGCTFGAGGVNCGWCMRDNTCRSGQANISLDGTCTGPDWRWTPGTCVALRSCTDATTCSSCIDRGNCGWCASTGQCLLGLLQGPQEGSCPAADWRWLSETCR